MARRFVRASSEFLLSSGGLDTAALTAFPFTLTAKVRQTSAQTQAALGFAGRESSVPRDGYAMLVAISDGTFRLQIDSGDFVATSTPNSGTDTMSTDTWYQWTGVFVSATERYMYCTGGALEGSYGGTGLASETFPQLSTTPSVALGALAPYWSSPSSPVLFWDGDVQDAAIYASQLSESDHLALYGGASPLLIQPHKLVHLYNCWTDGTTEADVIGSATLIQTGTVEAVEGPFISLGPHGGLQNVGGFSARRRSIIDSIVGDQTEWALEKANIPNSAVTRVSDTVVYVDLTAISSSYDTGTDEAITINAMLASMIQENKVIVDKGTFTITDVGGGGGFQTAWALGSNTLISNGTTT